MAAACAIGVLLMIAAGCPKPQPHQPPDGADTNTTASVGPVATDQPTAQPTASAAASAWVVHVRSSSPSIDPANFDTRDKRAKVFFDHIVRAAEGETAKIEHPVLKRDWPVGEQAACSRRGCCQTEGFV